MSVGNWLLKIASNYLLKEATQARKSYLCDFDRVCFELRPADVLLIEGRNRASLIIQKLTHSSWSHAALYIGRIHDLEDPLLRERIHQHYHGPINAQLIIEAEIGYGTIISPVSKYKNEHVRICRPAGLAYQDAQKVILFALNSIGKEYNVRHLIDLGRFLLGSRFISRRWRSTLFQQEHGQATQDICSSMIAAAFSSINFPILPFMQRTAENQWELINRNPKLFTPHDFDYSPYFNILKYPLFPFSELAPYRRLPWKDGLIYSDELGISNIIHEQKDKKN